MNKFPSSHCSGDILRPSPHIGVQLRGVDPPPVHVYPFIIEAHYGRPTTPFPHIAIQFVPPGHEYPGKTPVQVGLQPGVVPSSHVSGGIISPSPHIGLQMSGDVGVPPAHYHPTMTPVQFARHPLPSRALPSSQISVFTTLPSPHIGVQTEGEIVEPAVHDHPGIAPTQLELHPSPSKAFPSSQVSP